MKVLSSMTFHRGDLAMKPKAQSKAIKIDERPNREVETLIFGLAMTAMLGVMLILNAIS